MSTLSTPNVLLLISDEHNPFFSSPYGHPTVRTPNMDRLARTGTLYENAYCPSPLCMPARSAFMSGRYVHEIQTYNNCNVFTFSYPTYGAVLRQAGVHTVHVGKTDVYAPSSALGFSEMLAPGDRTPPGDINFRRDPLPIRRGAADRADSFGVPPDGRDPFATDNRRMEIALDWLQDKASDIDKPWVLSVNLVKPHFPHYVTKELWEMYAGKGDLPRYGADCPPARHPYARDLQAHFETRDFAEDQVRGLRRGYLGCVTYADRQLGRLLDALEQSGQLANTVVAYTTDHGEMLGKFGMWWKCTLYEDAARVPLIVAGPGFGPGQRVQTAVSLLDLQATLFEATGTARPDAWHGSPLQSLQQDDPERVVFSEYHGHGTRGSAYMIRKGPWKLIWYHEAPNQLFNLDEDPDEQHNLYLENPDRAHEMESALHDICSPEAEHHQAEIFIQRQIEAIAGQEAK
jgi:choline-sulfatase